MESKQTFVYEGVEVVMTGRTASKVVKNPCVLNDKGVKHTIYEITPLDPEFEWKRFVGGDDLYTIE